MKEGLQEFLGVGIRFFTSNATALYVGLRLNSNPGVSFYINLLTSLPPSGTEALTIDSSGNMGRQAIGGGGSVTSFSSGNLSPLFTTSVATASTTPALSFVLSDVLPNTFLAGSSSSGTNPPTFRALAYTDLSALVGTGSNTIAAGNDSRLISAHTQNTDTGTTQASFAINSGGTGVRLRVASGVLQLRNLADNADADLIVRNLTVSGTTTTINSETLTIDDNIIVLNNNVSSGTPTEDGGIHVRRGASASASVLWDETNDAWKIGIVGAEISVARTHRRAFTIADLVFGVLTLTHGLGQQFDSVKIIDNTNSVIGPDNITFSATTIAVDLTSFVPGFTGTYTAVVQG